MAAESPFRIALVVILLITMTIGAYFRLQAAASGEKIRHQDEGLLLFISLRLAGCLLWVATLIWLVFPTSVQWASIPIHPSVRALGVATGLGSSALMYWTLSNLGRNLTDTVVTRSDATLITHGPYRWVRHPFYVTAALLMGSVTLLTANALIGLSSILVLSLLAIRTPKEEQGLIERFGDQYRDYMEKTGRFFPRIGQ